MSPFFWYTAAFVFLALQLAGLALAFRRAGAPAELGALEARLEKLERRLDAGLAEGFAAGRSEAAREARELRGELAQRLEQNAAAAREALDRRLDGVDARLYHGVGELSRSSLEQLERLRATLELSLARLQQATDARLEEVRHTVDEKLQGTLERRLGESFSQVSERLEQVHRGLGEMQSLAHGVGDLKRLMSNVKTRGTWGEIQLRGLLEQMLAPGQYAANVETRRGSGERVEYAIRLPGAADEAGPPVWLPIDAKLHQEDYQRLLEAQESADPEAAALAARALERTFRSAARTIAQLYVQPPETTDFAILFVPVEGLYAEILRRPGLVDGVQREFRVMVAGPTTLCALLSSLQMGFRTLALQQRSSEVWEVLGAVKNEFERFGGLLEKAQKKIHEAGTVIDQARLRSRTMGKKLHAVQQLPEAQAQTLLGLPPLPPGEPAE